MSSIVTVYYLDVEGRTGSFAYRVDPSYLVAPYTEFLALLQSIRNLTHCHIERVTVTDDFTITSVTENCLP